MTSPFLIEFRLHGYAKAYARELIYDVARKFKIPEVAVPHITLYGPAETENIGKVVHEVKRIGRKYALIPFKTKGFHNFNNKVVFLDITPSKLFEEFRWELAQTLNNKMNELIIQAPLPKDTNPKFGFHSTIVFKDIDAKFPKIWKYIKSVEEPNINPISNST